ncbi:sensor histidine kinase [Portibacter lacus]|uniref:histidine kinase n=1 Tax=Portibacter lacus TaxID=1099794 RepID=A0AA37WI06_9BACT|nr:ATP-binding protein [Portibacter lacus]GLR19125.1 hypothetical protein GCM10007940_37410 [Portibacter lacus]
MKKILILFILLVTFGINWCFSQPQEYKDHEIDSLTIEFRAASIDSLKIKLGKRIIGRYISKAWNANNTGRYAESYRTYHQAFEFWEAKEMLSLFEKTKNSQIERSYYFSLANLYFNYGHLMGATGNDLERKFNYLKAYEIAVRWDDAINTTYGLTGIALIHMENNALDSASLTIKKTLLYPADQIGYNYSTMLFLDGMIEYMSKNYAAAKHSFSRGLSDATKRNNDTGKALTYYGLAKTYTALSKPDSSYLYAMNSLEIMKIMEEVQILEFDIAGVYEQLYEHFIQVGQPDSTLMYLQLANKKGIELREKRIAQMAAFQQELLNREKKASWEEKKRIQRESQFRTYSFLGILAVLSALGLILFRSFRQKQKANILLASQKAEVQKTLARLKETQAQLIQSEKMVSLGELTAGIAHEIQNPLNFVNNFSEVSNELIDEMNEEMENGDLDEAKLIAEDIKQNLEKINHHGKRADAIVKGMLQHSRKNAAEKEATDINKLADEYLRLAYHGRRAKDKSFNANLETNFDKSIGLVNVIPQDIGRVVLNLITNAFYAVNEKKLSQEKVIAGHGNSTNDDLKPYTPTVSISTLAENNKVKIIVKDNGIGIPKHVVDKIYQPFFTTKPTGEGTGLGLSMSYEIVTKGHQGELKVDTKEGEGTSFTITLPKI